MDDLWPLAGLRVRSGDLELRYLDDAHLRRARTARGRRASTPRRRCRSPSRGRAAPRPRWRAASSTYQWGRRASASPREAGRSSSPSCAAGEVLGTQSLIGAATSRSRATAETGSWLGLRHQGQGIGTRMRLMILHLFFEGFDGLRATTSAFDDNAASNGVTRRIGYAENGVDVAGPRGDGRRAAIATCWTAPPGTPGRPELRPDVDPRRRRRRAGAARDLAVAPPRRARTARPARGW